MRAITSRPDLAHDHGMQRRNWLDLRRCLCRGWISTLTRVRDPVLVALGELLEVEQLPPGHDQVANGQREAAQWVSA
jgi:hypothetical protein